MIFPKQSRPPATQIRFSHRQELLTAHRYYLLKKKVQALLSQTVGGNIDLDGQNWFIKFENENIILDFKRLNPIYRVQIKTKLIELENQLTQWLDTQIVFSNQTTFKFSL
jgi:hypothetical protein